MMKNTIQIRKTVRSVFILVFLLSSVVYTGYAWSAQGNLKKVTLKIEGMRCITCPATIKAALKRLPGVINVAVSYKEKTATVQYEKDKVTVEQMIKAIKNSGYGAEVLPGINSGK
ncbi:mercuric transport protein periplasmic component precursor [bacterium BMS3Bbin07]|nr:mercuric transport protein periplasmic component precursor [bacterium BMS3Bbin07]